MKPTVSSSLRCAADCERILRTLPQWFGIESSLREYARDSERFPTLVAYDGNAGTGAVGFITLREHFPEAWELHCMAVEAGWRNRGIGRQLHAAAEAWLLGRGARFLQVKTLAPAHPSVEYAQTRAFYRRLGYVPLEAFAELWGPHLPVLQLVKPLGPAG